MKSEDKYLLVAESLMDKEPVDHPNIDQIIVKPYLFYYVPLDMVKMIQKDGIRGSEGVYAYFARIPQIPKYAEFLKHHLPVKISIAKLIRSSEKVRVRGVNFPKYEDKELILKEPQLQKMAEKTDKFFKFFNNARSLEEIPRAKIEFEDGVIPPFAFKVLGTKVEEGYKLVSEVLITRQILALAERASDDLEAALTKTSKTLPRSVHTILTKTKKMKELRELLPMAKRIARVLKISAPEFIAAKAILNGILRSNDSKSELIALSEQ